MGETDIAFPLLLQADHEIIAVLVYVLLIACPEELNNLAVIAPSHEPAVSKSGDLQRNSPGQNLGDGEGDVGNLEERRRTDRNERRSLVDLWGYVQVAPGGLEGRGRRRRCRELTATQKSFDSIALSSHMP